MSFEILLMLCLLVLTLVFFILEFVPIVVTAMGLLSFLIITGIVSPDAAIAGFSNKAAVTIGALFVLSSALAKTGFLEYAADQLSRRARQQHWLGIGFLLLCVSLLSGLLNNTAVVAIFIPLLMNLSRRFEISPSKVMIPLSYASIFGGTLTLIGTSTNLLVSGIAEEFGERPLGMFEFSALGAVFVVLGMAYIMLFAPRLLPARADAASLTQKYQMRDYLTEVQLTDLSPLVGKSLRELDIGPKYDITVLAILRGTSRLTENMASIPLEAKDVLIVRGMMDNFMRLRSEQEVALLLDTELSDEELVDEQRVVVECLVTQDSSLIGKTLKQLDFRRHFSGFVLAVRRHGATLRERVADIPIQFFDTLLMLIPKKNLSELQHSEDVILISELDLEFKRSRFWWLVLAVIPAIIVLSATGILEITAGALLGATLLLVVGNLTPQEAFRSIDWTVIFLIAAFVPVGQAMVDTGTADFIAGGLLALSGWFDPNIAPYVLVASLYLITSLMTQMVSNNATAIILVPVAISISAIVGLDSRPFLFAICFAASAEFMTPTGYQTNLMVYGPGSYRFLDYTRFGAPLNLLFWLVASCLIPYFWPFVPKG